MEVSCQICGTTTHFNPRSYRCDCGGPWEPTEQATLAASWIEPSKPGLWRYQKLFSLDDITQPFTLGAGWTPLVEAKFGDGQTLFKLEYIAPTGSFKDRGIEIEMNHLKSMGIKEVVEDSSGNAGASTAAYAARAGIKAQIFAPDAASPAKLAQIAFFGAELHKIPGPRAETTKAALEAVGGGAVYASHACNPVYLLGQQSFAWEIWEQFGFHTPDAVVFPVGQGGFLLGAWLGFRRLKRAGLIQKLPRLYAAQPGVLAPVNEAFSAGLNDIPVIEPAGVSLAEGLAIVKPVRGRRILQALRETDGGAPTVSEKEIEKAWHALAHVGLFAEPSSAVAAAALPQIRAEMGKNAKIVVALTGSGLKSPPK